jgi:hypothetical protein
LNEIEYGELETGKTTISFASIVLANTNLKNGFMKTGDPTCAFPNLLQKLFSATMLCGIYSFTSMA